MDIYSFIEKTVKVTKMKMIKAKYEHEFEIDNCKLKYLLFPEENSQTLLVVFSAFPNRGRPAVYNYIDTFKSIKCNKLYILDNFGPDIRGGSYYLGENKSFFVEEAVSALIEKTAQCFNINSNDIITTGTSKGGFASLYFSFKYNYGAAIAGAPQTLLGNYLSSHKSYFEYIAGEYNVENVNFLNNLLFDVTKLHQHKPKVFLHVGKEERHYQDHMIPFCEHLSEHKINFDLDLQNYNTHADVGKFFPKFAIETLKKLI